MNNKKKAILLMILAALFFSLMATVVKFSNGYSLTQKVFFRNFIGLIIMIPILMSKKESIVPNNKTLILLRSIMGLLGVLFYYMTISHLNLANAVILNKTSPFFVMILSFIFLKESITKRKIFSLVLAIIGVTLIVKPVGGFSLTYSLTGLLSAFFAGGAYTTIKKLSKTDSSLVIVFYFCLISSLAMTPGMITSGGFILNFNDIIVLSLIGIFATIAQNLMTYSYRFAPASELSIYAYSEIIISLAIGALVWGEIPDAFSLTGAAIVFSAGIINYKK